MKKVLYENGPDEIRIGPVNNQTLMKRGVPVEFDDETAASLLKKPMFKEQTDRTQTDRGQTKSKASV